ncbi:lysozyme [Pseudomonas sp.]|uniref:lysozyme n=1 Tax=Pseudomonas sp. TaxID=306 RepID=UPI0025912B9A|nr:lysozyme [Pseudomonas sp.]
MNIELAVELCKRFEGFRSKPYLCPAGIPTIGYGSTRHEDGRRVSLEDDPITEEWAARLLQSSLERVYLPGVLRLCPGLASDPGRCNAVLDFTYNLGVGRLQTSTLRRKINARDWPGARAELSKWVRGGGRVLPGLVSRRAAEAMLF